MSAPGDLRSLLFGEEKPALHSSSSSLWSDDDDTEDFFSIKKSNSIDHKTPTETPTLFVSKSSSMPNFDHPHTSDSHDNMAISSYSTPVLNDPLLNPTEDDEDSNSSFQQQNEKSTISEKIEENQSPKKKRESKLFDVFLVVGLPQNTEENIYATHDPPTVLFQYPKTTTLPLSKIVEFCYPGGVKTKLIKNAPAQVSELYFGQEYLHNASNSFVFVLTGNESRTLYGFCVVKDEFVKDLPIFVDATEKSEFYKSLEQKTQGKNDYFVAAPRVYCLISEFPFFTMHYDILYAVIAHERLLRINYEYQKAQEMEITINRQEVLELLTIYYSAPIPAPGERFHLALPYEHKHIAFQCPRVDITTIMLTNWCTISLFRALPLSSILYIFAGVLLENQIVFTSKNLGLLSNVILSILPIIRPLEWQGLLVPILPLSIRETINAPVPYICGVVELTTNEIKQLVANEAIIVHLDAGSIRLPKQFPDLPEFSKLEEDVKKDHALIHSCKDSIDNPYYVNYEFNTISERLVASFNRYCNWIVKSVCNSFANIDPNDFELRDKAKTEFCNKISYHNQPFVRQFINTQSFNNYLEHFLKHKRH